MSEEERRFLEELLKFSQPREAEILGLRSGGLVTDAFGGVDRFNQGNRGALVRAFRDLARQDPEAAARQINTVRALMESGASAGTGVTEEIFSDLISSTSELSPENRRIIIESAAEAELANRERDNRPDPLQELAIAQGDAPPLPAETVDGQVTANPLTTGTDGDDPLSGLNLDDLIGDGVDPTQTGPNVQTVNIPGGPTFDIISLSDGTQLPVQRPSDLDLQEREADLAATLAQVERGNLSALTQLFTSPADRINFVTNLGRQLNLPTVSTRDAQTGQSIVPQAVEDLLGLDGEINLRGELQPAMEEGVGEGTGLTVGPRAPGLETTPFLGQFNQLSDDELESLFAVGSAIGLDIGDLRRQSRRLTPRDGQPAVGRIL